MHIHSYINMPMCVSAHTYTVHTRETIKVSLAKRNTLYVRSWICTINSVCVCASVHVCKSLQKCNGTFCTWACTHCINMCGCERWCLFTRVSLSCIMRPCPWQGSGMPLSPPGPLLNSPPVVLSAFTFVCQDTDTRWCPEPTWPVSSQGASEYSQSGDGMDRDSVGARVSLLPGPT